MPLFVAATEEGLMLVVVPVDDDDDDDDNDDSDGAEEKKGPAELSLEATQMSEPPFDSLCTSSSGVDSFVPNSTSHRS